MHDMHILSLKFRQLTCGPSLVDPQPRSHRFGDPSSGRRREKSRKPTVTCPVIMSSDENIMSVMNVIQGSGGAYDQFLLFGDSITEQSDCQDRGFALAPALQDGTQSIL
jgi:hypothetical protein